MGDYHTIELLKIKLVSVKSGICMGRVLGSRVYPAVQENGAVACLDEHCGSAYFPERA